MKNRFNLFGLMSYFIVILISVSFISCEDSGTNDDKSEIEKKINNSTWYGVYSYSPNLKSKLSFFAKSISFKDNGIANVELCKNYNYTWKYLKENNLDYLQITSEQNTVKNFFII